MGDRRPGDIWSLDRSVVSALPSGPDDGTSQDRHREWNKSSRRVRSTGVEYLLPRVVRAIDRQWPDALRPPPDRASADQGAADARAATVTAVEELGPWTLPFDVSYGVSTWTGLAANVARKRLLFRRDLILGTVAELFGSELSGVQALDIGCNVGFFSMDLASRGAAHVDGVDLRPDNIAKAKFLANEFDITNTTFHQADADAFDPGRQWDLVLNLGLLYHMTQPIEFVARTYDLCSSVAVFDTVCHPEPVSAFFLMGDKDVAAPEEGRQTMELHPTYRAAIDVIRHAGFSEVIEIVGQSDVPHELYAAGRRRCFLAIK